MLDPKVLKENAGGERERLLARGGGISLDEYLRAYEEWRGVVGEAERLRMEQNKSSGEIGKILKEGGDASQKREEMARLSVELKNVEKELAEYEKRWQAQSLTMPNIPHVSVPRGASAGENNVIKTWGKPPKFDFEPKPHWEIGEKLGILDFERATKIAGARFALLLGEGALLERALINFMLDVHVEVHGYREVLPPFIANTESFTGTGNLPKFEGDLFKLTGTDYYLVPTAEVPVTNIHRGEILDGSKLPLKYAAYTPCFRSEAGSYGKDTRGLIRQHQFNKVELVKFSKPESSYDELESLTANAEEILRRLGLCFRTIILCTGDMGFSSAKTYDIEVWFPSQNTYREISSCSNFEDFQARRSLIRYKEGAKGKPRYVHTLNGSGLAVGRTFAAILENFQESDGSVKIPPPLVPYMKGIERIKTS